MLNDLKEIIAIKSVLDTETAAPGSPFGKGCREALDWFLAKAQSYGLKTGELDGYCGWAEYGEGDECIAALCHLDVVPEGEGWQSDPYRLLIEDGKLTARGVADDKGAAVMCLHALKEMAQSKLKVNKRFRVICGLNEEHGCACIKYYRDNGGEIPSMSFVPDGNFPVINSEKGILHLKVSVPLDDFFEQSIAFISGGQTVNVVPDRATVSIFKDSPLGRKLTATNPIKDIFYGEQLVGHILAAGASPDAFSVKDEGEVLTIGATGRADHASIPYKGDNAVWKIFTVLDALSEGESKLVAFMREYFCTPESAQRLDIYRHDEESGSTTISLGVISADDDKLHFTLDIRLPLSIKHDEVKKNVAAHLPPHSKIEVTGSSPNLYIPKDSPLIQTLLSVYTSVTGEEGSVIKSGGGTYAKTLPNAAAFGPVFPGRTTNLHQTGENLLIDDFYKAAEIYKEVFLRLAK